MSNLNNRLDKLETIYQRPPGGATPEEWQQVREAVERIAAERGLDAEEVFAEAERVIAEYGWHFQAEGPP